MIVVLHIVVLCRFTLRSYAINVVPASYAWSTFTGPVSGDVQEVKPWKPSSSSSSFPGFESSNEESNSYAPDYVAKPQYSFAYGVENPNTGESHGHSETRDGATVTGEYSVMEPDGVLRRVQYTADPKNGFRASVRYVRPDGEETPSRDHGYQSGQNRVPTSRPSMSSLVAGYLNGGGGGGDSDDDDNEPFNVAPPQTSEYESDGGGDELFGAMPSPLPLQFGFDKFNGINNHVNGGGGDDDDDDGGGGGGTGDYRDETGPLTFKFPSSSSSAGPFFNKGSANAADSDDYDGDGDKYRPWDAFGGSPSSSLFDDRPGPFGLGPPSSPTPFGLASSLSPSFGVAPPSSQQQYVSFPRPPSSSQIAEPPPCRPPTSGSGADRLAALRRPNAFNYRTNHPPGNQYGKRPTDDDNDDDPDRFRSALAEIDDIVDGGGAGDEDSEDVENDSDDNDTDNAQHVTDVQVLPSSSSSVKSQPPPQPQSQPSSTSPPTPPSSPSPFYRPSSQPTAAEQGPSSTSPATAAVTPVVPTAVRD